MGVVAYLAVDDEVNLADAGVAGSTDLVDVVVQIEHSQREHSIHESGDAATVGSSVTLHLETRARVTSVRVESLKWIEPQQLDTEE